MHPNQPANCLNCDAVLTPDQSFCSRCGQKSAIHRLSFHELWHEGVHYLIHVDKSIFHLLRDLLIRPGTVAREYIAGKRTKYFKPLSFFLIVAGIVVFMTSYFHVVDDTRVQSMEKKAALMKDPVERADTIAMVGRMRETNLFVSKYSNFLHMLATPLLTLLFRLFYSRGKYSYVEHLVANMYFISLIMIFYGLVVVPLNVILHSSFFTNILLGLFFLGEIIYRGVAYYQFMGRKGAGALLKALGVSLVTVLVWTGGSFIVIGTYIRTGFK